MGEEENRGEQAVFCCLSIAWYIALGLAFLALFSYLIAATVFDYVKYRDSLDGLTIGFGFAFTSISISIGFLLGVLGVGQSLSFI